jgi:hypothetical protein
VHDPADACWVLGSLSDQAGHAVSAAVFTAGQVAPDLGPLRLGVRQLGHARDLTYAAFGLLVARRFVAAQLAAIAGDDIQRIPVQVAGSAEEFEIINVTTQVAALDEERTIGGRHEKGAAWLYIVTPAVDAKPTAGHKIFRLAEFLPIIIVEEAVKSAVEQQGWSGFAFVELPATGTIVA